MSNVDKVIKLVRQSNIEWTSRQIADHFGWSIQYASQLVLKVINTDLGEANAITEKKNGKAYLSIIKKAPHKPTHEQKLKRLALFNVRA